MVIITTHTPNSSSLTSREATISATVELHMDSTRITCSLVAQAIITTTATITT